MSEIDILDRQTLAQNSLRSAMDFHSSGDLEHAQLEYTRVLATDYRAADVLPLLAGIVAERGDIDLALYYWNKLLEGGKESACGWLKDQFGVSWQIVPVQLGKMLGDPDKEKSARVTKAFMTMKKFDLQALEDAYNGL